MTDKNNQYPLHKDHLQSSPKFPEIEEEVLEYWKKNRTFYKSIENRQSGENGSNEFVFYDGPPFANGLPHYGHLLTGYAKDTVCRYKTQIGRKVERRFGWDTHGLPAELEAQRILGIEDKTQIDEMGIGKFNETCRSSVLKYTREWEEYVTRQARWVDFENDYKTLDINYMESVIWAFKTLYDKDLAYEGYRVLPYCWNDQTPLSNHELRMDDDVYQDRQDQTATVGVRTETGELALIWTTTPWTLPSNLAIAVGPDIDYVTVEPVEGEFAGEKVIIGKDLLPSYAKELGENPKILETYKGSKLEGKKYYPMYEYFLGRNNKGDLGEKVWQIILADFVTTDSGTGLVHIAPAFGEDDMIACSKLGIKPVVPVDEAGKFTEEVCDYKGLQIFEANRYILRDLREKSGPIAARDKSQRPILIKQASYKHSYPHCWRCRKPLIYKAVSSWFIAVTKFRDRMLELNQTINWVPAHIKDGQFGKWLSNARDWSISRNRYWGAPIPVWKSDDPQYPRVDVYGSIADLEKDFGVKVEDLHRPFIDTLVRPNPDDPTGKSMMRRIPDVLDCWFESGSMPYAQVHYPFENRQWFEDHYPGDFIVEYIGQTRGWFYTLHILATALFDKASFRNCVSHGIVLGSDGHKMSKSLRNYPDVNEVFNRDGSDAMRWFLLSSPILRGGNLIVTEEGIRETVRQVLLPLWNTWYFFALYAGTCSDGKGYLAKKIDLNNEQEIQKLQVMDKYVLASLKNLAEKVKANMESYDISSACNLIRDYLDMLSNWYVRTSRQRFWDEDKVAFDTLYTVLENLCRIMASLCPMLTEEVWRGLTNGESVHLQDYPTYTQTVENDALVQAMEEVRSVVSAAHCLRKETKLRVRQPLRKLTVVLSNPQILEPFKDLIASEINVKEVYLDLPDTAGFELTQELLVLPKELSPEMRKLTAKLFVAAKDKSQWSKQGDKVVFDNIEFNGNKVVLEPNQYNITRLVNAPSGQVASILDSGTFIVLDTELDSQLKAEGNARDLIREIQDTRKTNQLHVADRIKLRLQVPADKYEGILANKEMICAETLAVECEISSIKSDSLTENNKSDNVIEIEKVNK